MNRLAIRKTTRAAEWVVGMGYILKQRFRRCYKVPRGTSVEVRYLRALTIVPVGVNLTPHHTTPHETSSLSFSKSVTFFEPLSLGNPALLHFHYLPRLIKCEPRLDSASTRSLSHDPCYPVSLLALQSASMLFPKGTVLWFGCSLFHQGSCGSLLVTNMDHDARYSEQSSTSA